MGGQPTLPSELRPPLSPQHRRPFKDRAVHTEGRQLVKTYVTITVHDFRIRTRKRMETRVESNQKKKMTNNDVAQQWTLPRWKRLKSSIMSSNNHQVDEASKEQDHQDTKSCQDRSIEQKFNINVTKASSSPQTTKQQRRKPEYWITKLRRYRERRPSRATCSENDEQNPASHENVEPERVRKNSIRRHETLKPTYLKDQKACRTPCGNINKSKTVEPDELLEKKNRNGLGRRRSTETRRRHVGPKPVTWAKTSAGKQ